MGLIRINCVFFALLFIFSSQVFAAWSGSQVIVSGKFGDKPEDFGLEKGEIKDEFPDVFLVFNDGKVMIVDAVNDNSKLFSNNGELLKVIPYLGLVVKEATPNGVFAFKWDRNIQGDNDEQVGVFNVENEVWQWLDKDNYFDSYNLALRIRGENLIIWNGKGYKYSPTGALISTYDQKPLELGIVKSYESLSGGGMQQTIAYEDGEFTVSTPTGIEPDSFVRDQAGFLYGTGKVDTHSSNWPWRYRVYKFDKCGKTLSAMDLPETKTQEIDRGAPYIVGEIETVFLEEYGPPVIGPDGSVYCWKRTPTTYSILKWTWVDDPTDPQPGPDAPADLKLIPSLDGLYITWGASPQDPGCVDGYELERATSADGMYSTVSTTGAGEFKFNDTSALPGSTYFYKVRAKSDGLYSPYTSPASGAR